MTLTGPASFPLIRAAVREAAIGVVVAECMALYAAAEERLRRRHDALLARRRARELAEHVRAETGRRG
jgi:hypothetical protein